MKSYLVVVLLLNGIGLISVSGYSHNTRNVIRTTVDVNKQHINSRLRRSDVSCTALPASSVSNSVQPNSDGVGVPRLHHDLSGLIRWIEKSGGFFDAGVQKGSEGWNLVSDRTIEAGETVLSIPKSICIFANPAYMEVPLLENAQLLMTSLEENQWRARLAVALLSERVRPSSHYRAYLRNLPFEFWGMPVFYSTKEFSIMQDLTLMQRTRDRCRFLSEFADSVLTPLQKTTKDPFSGHNADVNAFGWGFASAASRALRNPSVIGKEDGQVMVPGIDLADHHPNPTCAVSDDPKTDSFVLTALRRVEKGESLTIDYGPLSSAELLSDYGFTVDNNAHDKIALNCDYNLIHLARLVTGQAGNNEDAGGALLPSAPSSTSVEETGLPVSVIGRGGHKLDDRWLHQWQVYWLSALNLYGPTAHHNMSVGGPSVTNIDPRLWAYLRILYAKKEEDLTKHGYTPFTLQNAGSMLSADIEAEVIKTLVGISGVILRIYGSSMKSDLNALTTEQIDYEADSKSAGGLSMSSATTDEIIMDVHRILKGIFKDLHQKPSVLQGRRSPLRPVPAPTPDSDPSTPALSGFTDGVASEGTPYRIAIGNAKSKESVIKGKKGTSKEIEAETAVAVVGEEEEEAVWSPHSATTTMRLDDSESDYSSLQSEDEGDGEGSLEDAIASLSSKVERTVFSATSPGPGPAPVSPSTAHGEEHLSEEGRDSSAPSLGSDAASKQKGESLSGLQNIDSLGAGLPINVREALRYRIRKKMSLIQLVVTLGELHTVIRTPRTPAGPPASVPVEDIAGAAGVGMDGDKGERRAKIRELVDEVRNRAPKEDILITASKISSKWSGKGLAL